MKKRRGILSNSKGFSLVELIIAIAIMAILAGALTPVLLKHLENARRSKDLETATDLERLLVNAFAEDAIVIPPNMRNKQGYGIWIMMCNGSRDKAPTPYHSKSGVKSSWCGADKGVIFEDSESTSDWNYCQELDTYLKKEGINVSKLRTYSNGSKGGWDWIIVQVCFNAEGELCSRIFSGFKNQDGSVNKTPETNIEAILERSWIKLYE